MAHETREASAANSHARFALWRFTLRQFLIGIAAIALACVALRSASTWWVSAMLGLAFFAMTAALLLVAYRRDDQRAYWIGFAAFGWVYLLLLTFGWSVEKNSPVKASSLLTDRLSRASYDWLFAKANTQAEGGYGSGMGGGFGGYPGGGSAGMEGEMGYGHMAGGYGSDSMMSSGAGSAGSPPGSGRARQSRRSTRGGTGSGYPGLMAGSGGAVPAPAPAIVAPPSKTDFANVAHGIWAILLAACGGWLARLIYVTQPRSPGASSTSA